MSFFKDVPVGNAFTAGFIVVTNLWFLPSANDLVEITASTPVSWKEGKSLRKWMTYFNLR